MTIQGRFWFRYGSAAAAALLAFMLSFTLYHYFGDRTFTVIYLPVILFAAFAGGLGPAVFATVLCLSISAFLLRENLFSNPENFIDAAFFAVLGPIVGVVGRRLLEESEDLLRIHVEMVLAIPGLLREAEPLQVQGKDPMVLRHRGEMRRDVDGRRAAHDTLAFN